jgi:hypothetical protein
MRTVSIHNLTQDTITSTLNGSHLVVLPSKSTTATISSMRHRPTSGLMCFERDGNKDSAKKGSGVKVVLWPRLGRSCRIIKTAKDSQWQIYCTRVRAMLLRTSYM